MVTIESILEWYPADTFIRFDNLDSAVIGVDSMGLKLIYSKSKIIEVLQNEMEMDETEAHDWYEYNISTMYAGDKTPIICIDDF
jgi:hypothetical protein